LCLPALASALLRTGEPARAIARLREALGLVREFDMAREAVFALEALAEWLTAAGRVAAAARLLAAAAAARVKLGTPLMPEETRQVAALSQRLTDALGAEERARQDERGSRLQLTEAIDEASALANSVQ